MFLFTAKHLLLFWGDFVYIRFLVCACKKLFLGVKLLKTVLLKCSSHKIDWTINC